MTIYSLKSILFSQTVLRDRENDLRTSQSKCSKYPGETTPVIAHSDFTEVQRPLAPEALQAYHGRQHA